MTGEDRAMHTLSVLGSAALIQGHVSGSGDLEIRGKIQGHVTVQGRVSVTAEGSVVGNIQATHILIAGTVRGDLLAEESLSLEASCDVEGALQAPRVAIAAGAQARGKLQTGPAGAAKPITHHTHSPAPRTRTPEPVFTPAEPRPSAPNLTEVGAAASPARAPVKAPPAPARALPSSTGSPPKQPPLIPAFRKGSHGHRRV